MTSGLSHLEMCELGEEACEERIVPISLFLSLPFMEPLQTNPTTSKMPNAIPSELDADPH